MPPGFFVTFEGLDGSGKSTQLRILKEWLEARGNFVTATRQPGGTRIGDRIRGLLLDSRGESPSPLTELGLMFSDRAQSIEEVIRPALKAGHIVLCDRYTDSTEAYQGGGRQLGNRIVFDLHQSLCGGLQPDLTLLLLPDFALSLTRARLRNQRVASATGHDENRFEREETDFFRRVFDQYKEIAVREPSRVVTIESDGSSAGSVGAIHRRITDIVAERLRSRAEISLRTAPSV